MNVIAKKKWFFILSAIVIVPGLISLIFNGLKLSIDFTGGTKYDFTIQKGDKGKIEKILKNNKVQIHVLDISGENVSLKTSPIDQETKVKITGNLKNIYPDLKEKNFETVGPTIGGETQKNALMAVIIASIAITAYIAFAFRKVSRPVSSWKYGVCAIVALLHDILLVIGIFSILGYFLGVEIDSLFITALLTVMGFSVHDTIVVFDRIRENLRKNYNFSYEEVVNNSLLETMNRSLNTSLTVIIVLFALLLFGGETIRWFVIALLLGIISGTYSSIFNASPLLVVWYEWDKKRKSKKSQ